MLHKQVRTALPVVFHGRAVEPPHHRVLWLIHCKDSSASHRITLYRKEETQSPDKQIPDMPESGVVFQCLVLTEVQLQKFLRVSHGRIGSHQTVEWKPICLARSAFEFWVSKSHLIFFFLLFSIPLVDGCTKFFRVKSYSWTKAISLSQWEAVKLLSIPPTT